MIVAAIARYLGKSRPDAMDRPMRVIPMEEHSRIVKAVVLLRLAVALNQDQASKPVRLRTVVYPKAGGAGDCRRAGRGRSSRVGRCGRRPGTSRKCCGGSLRWRLSEGSGDAFGCIEILSLGQQDLPKVILSGGTHGFW